MAKTPRRESKEPAKNSAQAREAAAREERVAFLKFLMNSDRPISPEERNERKRFFHRLFHKKRSVLGSIHDIFFFVVMSDRKFLIEVMKKYFPDLAEALDFDKLTFEPTTRVNALFERKVADLVFVVPCKDPQNADVRIHIIAEHKAQHGRRDNRRTLLNIHEYVNLTTKAILNDFESDKSKKSDRCPQAIAIIFYTGKNEKYEAPKWSDLFFLPKELERYLISLEIPCVNITRLLTNGKIKGSPLVRGAFSALGYAGKGVLGKNFGAVVKILSKIKKIDWRARFLIDMSFTYAFGSANNEGQEITEESYLEAVSELENPEMKNELLFHTGWLSEEEEKELLEKGEKKGVKKGVDKALKRVATNMLAKRYSYDEVSECTGAPLPQIETLARSLDLA